MRFGRLDQPALARDVFDLVGVSRRLKRCAILRHGLFNLADGGGEIAGDALRHEVAGQVLLAQHDVAIQAIAEAGSARTGGPAFRPSAAFRERHQFEFFHGPSFIARCGDAGSRRQEGKAPFPDIHDTTEVAARQSDGADTVHVEQALLGFAHDVRPHLHVGRDAGALQLALEQGVELEDAGGVAHAHFDEDGRLVALLDG